MLEYDVTPGRCPTCNRPLRSDVVKTAMWRNERLVVVEDVPAQVCDNCMEQFYEEEVSDRLRDLIEGGSGAHAAVREILVPVFSYDGATRQPARLSPTSISAEQN